MRRYPFLLLLSLLIFSQPIQAQDFSPDVVFMEPVEETQQGEEGLPLYSKQTDPDRLQTYRAWLDNEAADRAFTLYRSALKAYRSKNGNTVQPDTYFIALVPGGNYADTGFRLMEDGTETDYADVAYIKLGPDEWRFGMTLLHETGHVVLTILNSGKRLPGKAMAAIPHSTPVITDRRTAFSEGYAIHLETMLAHLGEEQPVKNKYKHRQFLFGFWPGVLSEYYRASSDLTTFAQSRGRYYDVRENAFVFESAWKGPDYLRVQLEKSRDYASLRNPNQLLQSEGFYASFFFGLLMRGTTVPDWEAVEQRQDEILSVLAHVLSAEESPETPYLLDFISAYREIHPESYEEVLQVFLDLTHGVFVDPQAGELWREHYLAALSLDLEKLNLQGVNQKRQEWQRAVEAEPDLIYSRIGPQISCSIPGTEVHMPALGTTETVYFDVNTVQEGILKLIPGIGEDDIANWIRLREEKPYASIQDFRERTGIEDTPYSKLQCEE